MAHPALTIWFKAMREHFSTVHIYCSYRGLEEQNKAFKDGRSKLSYPYSKHNKTDEAGKPRAEALDLFQLTEERIAQFPYKFYERIALLSKDRKDPIRWGGTFKTLGDSNHFELKIS